MAVYFTDRDLGKRFPAALAAAGLQVEPHHSHFAHDTPDEKWMAEVAARSWVAVTHDRRIRYKPNEVKAVMDSGLALLVLVGKARTDELARNFIRTAPRIERFLERHTAPFIAKVYRPRPSELLRNSNAAGKVELWLD